MILIYPVHKQPFQAAVNLSPVSIRACRALCCWSLAFSKLQLLQTSGPVTMINCSPARKNKLSLEPCLAALLSLTPHNESHFPLPLPAWESETRG